MASKNQIDIIVAAQDRASQTLTQLEGRIQGLSETLEKLHAASKKQDDQSAKSAGSFRTLFASFASATLASAAVQQGIGQVTDQLRASIGAANAYQAAMTGLASTSAAFGQDARGAQEAAQRLASDGLMTVADAATALKNLLARGFSTEEAETLITRLKDSAAFGRQSMLGFGEAIRGATEGLRNENSVLVDNAGVTRNVFKMWQDYADQLDVSVTSLTTAQKRQAEFNGIMQETQAQVGDASRYLDTAAGKQEQLAGATRNAQIAIGTALQPAMAMLNQGLLALATGGMAATEENMRGIQENALRLATGLRILTDTTVAWGRTFVAWFQAARDLSLDPLRTEWNNLGQSMFRTFADMDAGFDKINNGSADSADAQREHVRQVAEAYSSAARQRDRQVAEEIRNFERANAQRWASFDQSLRDMVIAHRDKARSVVRDLEDENRAYAESAARRQRDFTDQMAELEESHKEKVAEITKEITEERQAGLVVDGVLYAQADQKKIAKLEESLAKENAAFEKEQAKRREKYEEDVADDAARHEEKLASLNATLAEENAILERHRADVSRIGEARKEDDISRLKRQFAEQNAEAARNHAEQLAKIRQQGSEAGSAFGQAMAKAQNDALDSKWRDFERKLREAGRTGGLQFNEGFAEGLQAANKPSPGKRGPNLGDVLSAPSNAIMGGMAWLSKKLFGFAEGGVIKRPTMLVDMETGRPFGQMAEAGPEAIVPLNRGNAAPQRGQQGGPLVHIENFHSNSYSDSVAFARELSWRIN